VSALKKARLQQVSSDESERPLGPPIDVQFNPTSLRMQLSNTVEGGDLRGLPARQYLGSNSTVLSLELVFDTADEGETDSPRSVREKTAVVEAFVLPRVDGKNKQAPPKLRFEWGNFIFAGVVDGVNIDIDLFAADGTPLRATVGLSIKEQDRKYESLETGPGANRQPSSTLPGQPGRGRIGFSTGFSTPAATDFSAPALAGESAADFAARVGVDPQAWRGLSAAGQDPLALEAGLEIGFNADLNASVGLGASAGVQAGVDISVEASFGLDALADAGFLLAAAGGLNAALESVQIENSGAADRQTREAFNLPVPAPVPSPKPALPEQPRPPLASTGLPSAAAQASAPPAPPPPKADARAVTFGLGVPLRPVVGDAAGRRAVAIAGAVALRSKADTGDPPETLDPSTPAWVALAARARSCREKLVTPAAAVEVKPACGCGCQKH
jgi:hypothetical protein